jgi:hypothetical protein
MPAPGRILEACEAGERARFRRAPGRLWQLGIAGGDQRQRDAARWDGGKLIARVELGAVRCGQCGAFTIDRPFELVAAAGLLRGQRRRGQSEQKDGDDGAVDPATDRHAHGGPTRPVTSEQKPARRAGSQNHDERTTVPGLGSRLRRERGEY